VHYTVRTIALYKGQPEVRYGREITFVTGGNSALCGVNLAIGEEYLIGLTVVNGNLYAGSCGLLQLWEWSGTEEDVAALEKCDDAPDMCPEGGGEFQVRCVCPKIGA